MYNSQFVTDIYNLLCVYECANECVRTSIFTGLIVPHKRCWRRLTWQRVWVAREGGYRQYRAPVNETTWLIIEPARESDGHLEPNWLHFSLLLTLLFPTTHSRNVVFPPLKDSTLNDVASALNGKNDRVKLLSGRMFWRRGIIMIFKAFRVMLLLKLSAPQGMSNSVCWSC